MRTAAACIFVLILAGCGGRAAAASKKPTSAPATKPATLHTIPFDDAAHDFGVRYPADWVRRSDKNNVLVIDARAGDTNSPELSIAVPNLGVHVPGFIPLPAVESGYLNDLKKRLNDVRVGTTEQLNFAGASSARRFTVTGVDRDEKKHELIVLLLVRGDRLYITSAEAFEQEFDVARKAFDAVSASWAWKTEGK